MKQNLNLIKQTSILAALTGSVLNLTEGKKSSKKASKLKPKATSHVKENYKKKLMAYSLHDLIYNFPEIAHFKEAKNFTYQLSNQANLDVFGMKSEEEIIGKTVFDLKREVMKNGWSDTFADEIHASDLFVVENRKPVEQLDYKTFLNKSGYVVVHSMLKLPVFNKYRKVEGILTLSFNSTGIESAMRIKELYLDFYENKVKANFWFMRHIGFQEGIDFNFSPREMDCLLALLKYRINKKVSHFLAISLKTLDNHFSKIKEKTECRYNAQSLVEILAAKIHRI